MKKLFIGFFIIILRICGTDIHIFHGESFLDQYPIIPGHEFSGEIVEVGSKVSKFKVGDKVAVEPNV